MRDPARLVAPVLEQRLARLQQLLGERRVEALEPRQQHDGVAAGAGDRHGVELQVAEALDDRLRRRPARFPRPDARRGSPVHSGLSSPARASASRLAAATEMVSIEQ